MGTNYYFYKKPDCECCGRPFEPLHIGKSSGGWCFSLHVLPEEGINTLEDWSALFLLPDSFIRNEYGEKTSVPDMMEIITNRSWERKLPKDAKWFRDNHAIIGPNGLVRHAVDGHHCIGHGEGTWDYITVEFS